MPITTNKPGESLSAADTAGTPFANNAQWHEFNVWSNGGLLGEATLTDAEVEHIEHTKRVIAREENRPVTWLEYLRTVTEQ